MSKIRVAAISQSVFAAESWKRSLDADARFQPCVLLQVRPNITASLREDLPDVLLIDARCRGGWDWIGAIARELPQLPAVLIGIDKAEDQSWGNVAPRVRTLVSHDASLEFVKDTIQAVHGEQCLCSQAAVPSSHHLRQLTSEEFADEFIHTSQVSARELDMLQLLSQGLTNKEIASLVNLSVHTVKNHIHNIFKKLGIHKRSHAFALIAEVLAELPVSSKTNPDDLDRF